MPDRSNPAAESGSRAPSRKDKELFLRKWFSDPQTYPDEFKAWLRSSLVADPNITWEVPQIPRLPGTKIIDHAITGAQLAPDSVGPTEIAPDAVGTSEIAADSVGASEIAPLAITNAEVAAAAAILLSKLNGAYFYADGAGSDLAGGGLNFGSGTFQQFYWSSGLGVGTFLTGASNVVPTVAGVYLAGFTGYCDGNTQAIQLLKNGAGFARNDAGANKIGTVVGMQRFNGSSDAMTVTGYLDVGISVAYHARQIWMFKVAE